jgi:hypothetical protein
MGSSTCQVAPTLLGWPLAISSVRAVLPTKGSPTTTKRMLPSRAAESSGTTLLPKRAIQAV